MNQETWLEVILTEDMKEEVVWATLPKLYFLSDFPSAKVIHDQNDLGWKILFPRKIES